MISLDLMKSSEVRKTGDRSNNIANFEGFWWNISKSTNLIFLKIDIYDDDEIFHKKGLH